MLEVSEKANELIKTSLETEPEPRTVRIYKKPGSGSALAMELDRPRDADEMIFDNGITFVVDKELLAKAKPIVIDWEMKPRGPVLKLTSALDAVDGNC